MKCTTYYFRPLGLLLLLCLIPLCSIAQNITVKGIVKDNLGESVIGANVTEKGTTNGMITDLDGNFSLTVQKNATLVISYIGYVTQEIAIKGNTNLNICLLYTSQHYIKRRLQSIGGSSRYRLRYSKKIRCNGVYRISRR